MTEVNWSSPEIPDINSLAPAIRNRILGREAEKAAEAASIISFCWEILAREQRAQAEAGKPALSDEFIIDRFGLEYIIDVRPNQE